MERAPTAEHEAFLARAAAASTITERFQLGVDVRLKAGLGFGYSAAIRENGVLRSLGAGNRTLEPITRMNGTHLLEIGSVTKTFTGILVHLAVLEGKLTLATKLESVLPALKGTEAGSITILELGLHQSGLLREPKGITIPDPTNPRHHLNRDEVISALAKTKLTAIPAGQTEHPRTYSNWGYLTLGIVLEKVFAGSYKDLVEKRVLFPLGMKESGVDRKTRKHSKWTPKASPGYALDGTSLPLRDYDSFAAATGGIESNADDMTKFLTAIENPPAGKLGDAMKAGMTSGIGWDSAPGKALLWKNGATSAHAAVLVFDRTAKKGIFIGSNTMVSPDELGFFAEGDRPKDDLLTVMLPKRVPLPDEITRLKGSFIPAAPIPADEPPLRRVDVSETLGHLVAHFAYDVYPSGGLLVPEANESVWRYVDGMDNRDGIRVTADGILASTRLYSERATTATLKKVSNEPEKYPAFEQ